MAWTPISGIVSQFSNLTNDLANDYWLKLYDSGTTNPYSMATDSGGLTRLAKCKLNAEGYPISNENDDTTVFIPHIDQTYRIVLYRNETDADADTTANAAWNVDAIQQDAAQLADSADITMKGTTLQAQDDYDRSPLFVDGTDFTAGAGPHVITVPSDWTPSNADMRFYRLDNSGIVTDLTPTLTDSTTFTLAETLLSTDTIYIGDDTFRNQMDGDPLDIRTRLDVYDTSVVDGKQDNPSAVAGYVSANAVFTRDAGSSSTGFDIDSNLTVSTYESIGPTGSGADFIWSELDILPSDVKFIDLRVKCVAGDGSNIAADANAEFRPTGSTDTIDLPTASSNITTNSTSALSSITTYTYLRVAVGTNRSIDSKWSSSGSTTNINMYLSGFGV